MGERNVVESVRKQGGEREGGWRRRRKKQKRGMKCGPT